MQFTQTQRQESKLFFLPLITIVRLFVENIKQKKKSISQNSDLKCDEVSAVQLNEECHFDTRIYYLAGRADIVI